MMPIGVIEVIIPVLIGVGAGVPGIIVARRYAKKASGEQFIEDFKNIDEREAKIDEIERYIENGDTEKAITQLEELKGELGVGQYIERVNKILDSSVVGAGLGTLGVKDTFEKVTDEYLEGNGREMIDSEDVIKTTVGYGKKALSNTVTSAITVILFLAFVLLFSVKKR